MWLRERGEGEEERGYEREKRRFTHWFDLIPGWICRVHVIPVMHWQMAFVVLASNFILKREAC
jgi:hypothetical protein